MKKEQTLNYFKVLEESILYALVMALTLAFGYLYAKATRNIPIRPTEEEIFTSIMYIAVSLPYFLFYTLKNNHDFEIERFGLNYEFFSAMWLYRTIVFLLFYAAVRPYATDVKKVVLIAISFICVIRFIMCKFKTTRNLKIRRTQHDATDEGGKSRGSTRHETFSIIFGICIALILVILSYSKINDILGATDFWEQVFVVGNLHDEPNHAVGIYNVVSVFIVMLIVTYSVYTLNRQGDSRKYGIVRHRFRVFVPVLIAVFLPMCFGYMYVCLCEALPNPSELSQKLSVGGSIKSSVLAALIVPAVLYIFVMIILRCFYKKSSCVVSAADIWSVGNRIPIAIAIGASIIYLMVAYFFCYWRYTIDLILFIAISVYAAVMKYSGSITASRKKELSNLLGRYYVFRLYAMQRIMLLISTIAISTLLSFLGVSFLPVLLFWISAILVGVTHYKKIKTKAFTPERKAWFGRLSVLFAVLSLAMIIGSQVLMNVEMDFHIEFISSNAPVIKDPNELLRAILFGTAGLGALVGGVVAFARRYLPGSEGNDSKEESKDDRGLVTKEALKLLKNCDAYGYAFKQYFIQFWVLPRIIFGICVILIYVVIEATRSALFIVPVLLLLLVVGYIWRTNEAFLEEIIDICKRQTALPQIIMTGINFAPEKVLLYKGTNNDGVWNAIPEGIISKLKDLCNNNYEQSNTSKSISLCAFDEGENSKNYLLFNLVDKDTPVERIQIILNAAEITCENIGGNVLKKLKFVRGYSMKADNRAYTNVFVNFDYDLPEKIQESASEAAKEFSIPIAYACPEGEEASLSFDGIARMVSEYRQKDSEGEESRDVSCSINLLSLNKTPEVGGGDSIIRDIIAFSDTAYLFEMETETDKYEYTAYINREELIKSEGVYEIITPLSDKFEEVSEKALERAIYEPIIWEQFKTNIVP